MRCIACLTKARIQKFRRFISDSYAVRLFSTEWNKDLCEAWNSGPHKDQLAGAETVKFILQQGNKEIVTPFNWDSSGHMSVASHVSTNESIPNFTALENNWNAFIRGEFRGIQGVLSGKLTYKGSMLFVMKFGPKFDYLANVAKESCKQSTTV